PLVRQYAAKQLSDRPVEEAQARTHHATDFASFVAEQAPELFRNPKALAAIESEQANVHAAWGWAVSQQDVGLLERLIEGLATWNLRSGLYREWGEHLAEAIAWLRRDFDEPAQRAFLARLLVS